MGSTIVDGSVVFCYLCGCLRDSHPAPRLVEFRLLVLLTLSLVVRAGVVGLLRCCVGSLCVADPCCGALLWTWGRPAPLFACVGRVEASGRCERVVWALKESGRGVGVRGGWGCLFVAVQAWFGESCRHGLFQRVCLSADACAWDWPVERLSGLQAFLGSSRQ